MGADRGRQRKGNRSLMPVQCWNTQLNIIIKKNFFLIELQSKTKILSVEVKEHILSVDI